jgi:hypothetical protein
MFTIGGGTAQVLRVLVTSKMLGWKPADPDGSPGAQPNLETSAIGL